MASGTAARTGLIFQIWKTGCHAATKDMAEEGHRPATINRWRQGGRRVGSVNDKGGFGHSAGQTEDLFG